MGFALWHTVCKDWDNIEPHTQKEHATMYNKAFFRTTLGQASLASIVAMTAMIALTSQMNLVAQDSTIAQPHGSTVTLVELA